jgi:hypothetical protein
MAFGIFDYTSELDKIVLADQLSLATLQALREKIGNDALPGFLIDYINAVTAAGGGMLAIHTASSIARYRTSANQAAISRKKGFMGKSQLELQKFPTAVHHVKIFYNGENRAKLFYKNTNNLQFIQNLGASVAD